MAILIVGFLPQNPPISVSELQLNEIVRVTYRAAQLPNGVWIQEPQVSRSCYWLGRRNSNLCGEYWLIDWWCTFREDPVFRGGGRVVAGLRERRSHRFVLVQPRRYRRVVSTYDLEADQNREIFERFGVRAETYRWGMVR